MCSGDIFHNCEIVFVIVFVNLIVFVKKEELLQKLKLLPDKNVFNIFPLRFEKKANNFLPQRTSCKLMHFFFTWNSVISLSALNVGQTNNRERYLFFITSLIFFPLTFSIYGLKDSLSLFWTIDFEETLFGVTVWRPFADGGAIVILTASELH